MSFAWFNPSARVSSSICFLKSPIDRQYVGDHAGSSSKVSHSTPFLRKELDRTPDPLNSSSMEIVDLGRAHACAREVFLDDEVKFSAGFRKLVCSKGGGKSCCIEYNAGVTKPNTYRTQAGLAHLPFFDVVPSCLHVPHLELDRAQ